MVLTDTAKIAEALSRGVAEIIDRDRLEKRLASGEQLRVKLGIDPTSPHIHLGRSVPLLKMRDLQQLGHRAVLIVGDFTGVIGDTSDKESERPMLERGVIEENKKNYFAQIGTLVDLDAAELHYNSQWLEGLTYRDIGEHADQFSVADFIARDNIRRRLDAGARVSLREVLYPLMQGYDSVAVKADVELGGVDQRFNLLAGRTLQEHAGQPPQAIIMTTFPIEGTDGRKMSSSLGNTINFGDEPNDMYGKVMRVRDELIQRYFEVLTRVPCDEVQKLKTSLTAGTAGTTGNNLRDAKMRLAREIVTLYHGVQAARDAEAVFVEVFQKGATPEDTKEISVPRGTLLLDALVMEHILPSKSEARRLLDAGGVRNADTGERLEDQHTRITEPITLKVGKRMFVRLIP